MTRPVLSRSLLARQTPEVRAMTLHVRTARIGAKGLIDALDITRKSATGDGLAFAPSWGILRPALDARREAEECRKGAGRDGAIGMLHRVTAQEIEDRAWAVYEPAFITEMRQSYREHRAPWDRLLARESIVLLCYCGTPERCHRRILAERILPKLGAIYDGEVWP